MRPATSANGGDYGDGNDEWPQASAVGRSGAGKA